jgi:hypothetical protein
LLVVSSMQNIHVDFVEDVAEIMDEYELDILVYIVVDSSIIYYSVEHLLFLSFLLSVLLIHLSYKLGMNLISKFIVLANKLKCKS